MNDNFNRQRQDNGDLIIFHFGTPKIRIRVDEQGRKFDAYLIGNRAKWICGGDNLDDVIRICKKTITQNYEEQN